MSDLMNQIPGSPGGAAPPQGGAPDAKNLSPFNGADAAYMKSRGMVDQNMSIKDYIEKSYGIPIDAPVSALQSAVAEKMQMGSHMGKMRAASQQAPEMPSMAPRQGMPGGNALRMPAQPSPGPEQGLEGLAKAMRR